MKVHGWTSAFFVLSLLLAALAHLNSTTSAGTNGHPAPAASEDGIDLFLSPDGGAADAIVHEVGRAQAHVRVQAYYFTSAPMAQALLDAKKRGVKVAVILDDSQRDAQYSSSRFFVNQGFPTYIAQGYAIYHHKVILIDDHTIITGSMNFTRAGDERNAENVLIIRDKPVLFAAYLERFEKDLEGAERLE